MVEGVQRKGTKKGEKEKYLAKVEWKGTNNTIHFDIKPMKDFIPDMNVAGNLKILQETYSLRNMHFLDEHGYPRRFITPEEFLLAWCPRRLEDYERRKNWWLEEYRAQFDKESNRYKYVRLVVDKKLNMYQQDDALEKDMLKYGLKKFKSGKTDGLSFEYLLSMQMRSMTVKKLEEIKKEVDRLQKLIDDLDGKSPSNLWREDLEEFKVGYKKFLATRKEEGDGDVKFEIK